MAPIAKEPDLQNSSAPVSPVNASQPKAQPVALEVSVTVNGARTVDGSDKREPFSETTQTVLVFGNGAVIRLNSSVAPGQLLFLTNEKTKKEVVCQVVKSKNYRSVSGYVELEFTEPAVGFWGMRFPTDRIAPVTTQPSSAAPIAPAKPAPVPAASAPEPKVVQAAPLSVAPPAVQKIEAPAPPPPAPVNSATEELKKETARLQEQLSSMLFSETPAPKPAAPVPHVEPKAISEATSKIFELTKAQATLSQPNPAPVTKPFEPLNLTPIASKSKPASSVQDEEVKIPSWLEPLARNAAATVPAPPTVALPAVEVPISAEAQVAGESYDFASQTQTVSVASNESEAPSFGASFLETSDIGSGEAGTSGSNKGLWIGAIAATVLLAAGGGWWYTQQSGRASVKAASAAAVSQPIAQPSGELQTQSLASTSAPAGGKTYSNSSPINTQPSNAGKPTLSPAMDVQKIPQAHDPMKSAPASETSGPSEPVEQTRKPAFNQIRLASPTVKGGSSANAPNVGEPGIAMENSSAPSPGAVTGGLVGSHGSQPTAPVPVGGEVKAAQMISSVPPVYPQLARSQRISGDVKIDALIDDHGRVTGMKVLSGPIMLHQAAMDALHQWKYRPATLNGEPVSMHLTVTIQFRLQ
ncbi:MAG TPA: TonB family protein [Candidatus Sulfotelmatobacter sp.]|jgi:protein TonB|nr:TonB family protein [Candidatus Sulfotelmatobacter sp.]